MHAESVTVVDTSVDSIVSQYSAAQCDPAPQRPKICRRLLVVLTLQSRSGCHAGNILSPLHTPHHHDTDHDTDHDHLIRVTLQSLDQSESSHHKWYFNTSVITILTQSVRTKWSLECGHKNLSSKYWVRLETAAAEHSYTAASLDCDTWWTTSNHTYYHSRLPMVWMGSVAGWSVWVSPQLSWLQLGVSLVNYQLDCHSLLVTSHQELEDIRTWLRNGL